MKKETKYEDYLKRIKNIERIQELGIEIIYKKSTFKIVAGIILFSTGTITLPLPTGSIILIAAGLSLMTAGGIDLYSIKEEIFRKIRVFRK